MARETGRFSLENRKFWMTGLKAEEQLKQENGNIFNNKEKISSVLKTAVKDKLGQMDCLIGKYYVIPVKKRLS